MSSTNARLADGYERVIILAPMPTGYGLIPGAAEDAAAMSANANIFLVTPDEQSTAAIDACFAISGPNAKSLGCCEPCVAVGEACGARRNFRFEISI